MFIDTSELFLASEFDRKVMTMALNQQNKAVYWSDQTTTTIYKLPFNSNRPVVVKTGMHGEVSLLFLLA